MVLRLRADRGAAHRGFPRGGGLLWLHPAQRLPALVRRGDERLRRKLGVVITVSQCIPNVFGVLGAGYYALKTKRREPRRELACPFEVGRELRM